jgi:adenine-specific DNA-methyltransferase
MQNLLEELIQLLSEDDRLVSEGKLLKNKVIELALNMDAGLIKLLLKNESIKRHFFAETCPRVSLAGISGVLVFDKIKFQRFVSNKQFLPDSYTAFKNKIGLVNENNDYLSESREVVLAWPYKDCVLEGGQTKEDQKRDEIFWNETLAPDEIDRLLAPKVFTNFKRYDKNGEHVISGNQKHVPEGFNRGIDFSKENLIIKGNNLLALHSLYKRFTGKVKLIYIDPPYNTGNDGFHYNDSFNHSTWLTFMKSRLKVAKELLKDDGVIFIQCDDNEQAYLKVLMDEVFGRENFVVNLIWRKRTGGGSDSKHFSVEHEYLLTYCKNIKLLKIRKVPSIIENYSFKDDQGNYTKKPLHNAGLQDSKGLHYDIECPDGTILKGKEHQWVYSESNFHEKKNANRIVFNKKRNSNEWNIQYKLYMHESKGSPPTSILYSVAKSGDGTEEIKKIFNNIRIFDTPKPEKLIKNIIEMTTQYGDLVLDYHLGSGTTAAVAHKMGRQYIGIEQMDYIETVTIERIKKVIAGEQGGISKSINWQGSGSFIYCELMEYNEAYIDRIRKAKTTKELLAVWKEMQEKAFISYNVDPKVVNANISEFESLSLDEQKRFLVELLDKNQLYVNYSEIDDEDYKVSDTDKKLNRMFYGEK